MFWTKSAASLAFASTIASALSTGNDTTASCCNSTLESTTFSILYGLPLVQFVQQAVPLLETIGTNKPSAQKQLAGTGTAYINTPNADTLYTTMIIDLSQNDLVVTAPNVTDDRFWIYPFYDQYGNDFANIGSVGSSPPGPYLVTQSNATHPPGLELTPGCKYNGIIRYPTTYGIFLERIYVKENTTADLKIIYGYQNELTVTPVPHAFAAEKAPALTLATLNVSSVADPYAQILTLLARVAPYNLPEDYSDRERVAGILKEAGIANGVYTPVEGVNLTEADALANSSIAASISNPADIIFFNNGWEDNVSGYSGNFNSNYAVRAYISIRGYLQLTSNEVLYPVNTGYVNKAFVLAANESLLYDFSGIPQIEDPGFWSLTAYTGQEYLIPNPLGRYNIGTRNNLTYEDGTFGFPVFNNNVTSTVDKPFQILLQAADNPPPANWTSNWLPTQAGGGTLQFVLRWYHPSPELANGSYQYPSINVISPITA